MGYFRLAVTPFTVALKAGLQIASWITKTTEARETSEAAEARDAAREALEVAGQLMWTNPALVERAERERNQSREALTDILRMAVPTDTER